MYSLTGALEGVQKIFLLNQKTRKAKCSLLKSIKHWTFLLMVVRHEFGPTFETAIKSLAVLSLSRPHSDSAHYLSVWSEPSKGWDIKNGLTHHSTLEMKRVGRDGPETECGGEKGFLAVNVITRQLQSFEDLFQWSAFALSTRFSHEVQPSNRVGQFAPTIILGFFWPLQSAQLILGSSRRRNSCPWPWLIRVIKTSKTPEATPLKQGPKVRQLLLSSSAEYKVSRMMRPVSKRLFAKISLAKVEGHGEAYTANKGQIWRKWRWQLGFWELQKRKVAERRKCWVRFEKQLL